VKLTSREDAITLGLNKYFTGKECPKGHTSERYVKGYCCAQCAVDRMAKKRSDKCPKLAAYKAKHYRKFRDKYAEYNSAYVEKNKASKSEYDAERYKIMREEIGGKVVEWRRENPEKLKAQRTNRKARIRGADGSHTSKDIERILSLQSNRCACCLVCVKKSYHVDHIFPVSKGGSNYPENLQILCPTCNIKKSNKMPEEWAMQNGKLL